jgi:hypothetical protein
MGCAFFVAGCGGGGGPGVSAPGAPTNPGIQSASGITAADVRVCVDLDADGQCQPAEQAAASVVSDAAGRYAVRWTGAPVAPLLALVTVPGPDLAAVSPARALACLDANANRVCDRGEPAAYSHDAGLYRLAVPVDQAGAAIFFPDAQAFSSLVPPRIVAGNRHLSVYWDAVASALDYEVWWQAVDSDTLRLSRAAIAAAAGRVHTVTALDPTKRYRVWVKARLSGGERRVSAGQVATPVASSPGGSASSPTYVPALIDLPVLDIQTAGGAPVVSRDDYLRATFSLYADSAARSGASPMLAGVLDIRGRGNSTWTEFPKKPYRLRLDAAAGVLGMPANRHWVLLANHGDRSLLRNETVFEVSRRAGLAWTPRSRFVEVFLNGEYLGHYQLTEQIRTGSQRVAIASLGGSDDALPAVSGGYLLELDWRAEDTTFTTVACGLALRLDTPESPVAAQTAYIRTYVEGLETALLGAGFADPASGYAAWLDVDAFIDWYIVNELAVNADAFRGSTWLYKDRDARLSIGPVWDYDLAMGNNPLMYAEDPGDPRRPSRLGQTCWYRRLLQDPAFVNRLKMRWQALRPALASLPDWLDAQAALLANSQANNFARWPVLDKPGWPSVVVTGSHAGEVEYLRWWLERRVAWLDSQWGTGGP